MTPAEPAADAPAEPAGWRAELRLALTALQYFTRIPVPAWVGYTPGRLNACTRWFPAVGLLVGTLSALAGAAGLWLGGPMLAAVLALAAGVWTTGGFHEDGLADSCDGLGGGWTREQVLAIMKDSRVGSYAVLGLVLVLLAKFALLAGFAARGAAGQGMWALAAALIAGHGASRWMAMTVIWQHDYVRIDDTARAKPVADGVSTTGMLVAALPLLPALAWLGGVALPAFAAGWLMRWWFVRLVVRRLGGYTGDSLGATQQLCELAFYLGLAAGWRYGG